MSKLTKTRFRTDSAHYAELAATPDKAREYYANDPATLEVILRTPPPEPGDLWRITWHAPEGEPSPLAGYAIACPRCREVHRWTTANNCHVEEVGGLCVHERSQNGGRLGSCWTWTGSAEEGTLTATPSLHNSGGCGWHGFLTNGELREC
jgi:hypothetical protein